MSVNPVLADQLAKDYCTTPEEILTSGHIFTEFQVHEGQRHYEPVCPFKAVVINGKLVCSGEAELMKEATVLMADVPGAWAFDAKYLRPLDELLQDHGCRIRQMHPFFIASTQTQMSAPEGIELTYYNREDIQQFKGDKRFDSAYTFVDSAPDVIGVSASLDGMLLGMAGASEDSPTMWQIGINVLPGERGRHIATLLVSNLKNKILKQGILPYYGTAFSHLASQRVALNSGFTPAWVELVTERIE